MAIAISPPSSGALTEFSHMETLPAEAVIAHMLSKHHPRLALACSFQKEDAVVLDMLLKLEPNARVFTIDTGVLFPETYESWRALENHYGIKIEAYDAQDLQQGPWSASTCCGQRKVEALGRALSGLDGWITGLRRQQSPTRANAPKVEFDLAHQIWKANPIAAFTDTDVWNYINANNVPYNPLHDRGYDSIGCMPCTAPGSGREGRWAGSDKTECGIHVIPAVS